MSRPIPTIIKNYPSEDFDFRNQPKTRLTKGFKVTEAEAELLKDLKLSFSAHWEREVTDSELIRNMIDFCISNDEVYLNKIKLLQSKVTESHIAETLDISVDYSLYLPPPTVTDNLEPI